MRFDAAMHPQAALQRQQRREARPWPFLDCRPLQEPACTAAARTKLDMCRKAQGLAHSIRPPIPIGGLFQSAGAILRSLFEKIMRTEKKPIVIDGYQARQWGVRGKSTCKPCVPCGSRLAERCPAGRWWRKRRVERVTVDSMGVGGPRSYRIMSEHRLW